MKDNSPLVSVVMAVYNAEKYLAEAVESILQQTLKDFEFIIIDDGSTDSSLSILNKYGSIDSRIKIISRENKGLPSSLNEGIWAAKGKYIARMDADDISVRTRFEEQVFFLEKNSKVGVCGAWAEVFNGKKVLGRIKHPEEHEALKVKLIFSVCFVHPTVMFRRKLFAFDKFFYNEMYINSQDYELWTRMFQHTKFYNIQKVLLHYRDVNTSITKSKSAYIDIIRYELVRGIQEKVLNTIDIHRDSFDSQTHFTASVNERLKNNDIDIYQLLKGFKTIKEKNKKIKKFNQVLLSRELGRKLVIASFYNPKSFIINIIPIISSSFFYIGVFTVVAKRLKYV